MDTYEGDQEEPLSLHKYLYCHADPVNGCDPSGQFEMNAPSLATAEALHLYMQGARGVVLGMAKRQAIRTLAKVAAVAAITTLPATRIGPEPSPQPVPLPLPPEVVPIPFDEDDSSDQYVVRAGVASAKQLTAGTKLLDPARYKGIKSGFSVQSAPRKSVYELARGGRFPHPQISVTRLSSLVAAGALVGYNVRVVPTESLNSENHCTVDVPFPLPPSLATALSAVFFPMPNPCPLK
jgi:hypothetical protein